MIHTVHMNQAWIVDGDLHVMMLGMCGNRTGSGLVGSRLWRLFAFLFVSLFHRILFNFKNLVLGERVIWNHHSSKSHLLRLPSNCGLNVPPVLVEGLGTDGSVDEGSV